MELTKLAKTILPVRAFSSLRRAKWERERRRVAALPPLRESEFKNVLSNNLQLEAGDLVYVHSGMDGLNLGFPFYRILFLIQEVIGREGTVVFPTYPNHRISSYEWLKQGNVFDVRRTPSYTGILTEFARKQKNAVRSLHPTKSVCALGKYALELTKTHQQSPFPYDYCSPYYRIMEHDAKIIGLGVSTKHLSFVHCVDDALKDKFPVQPYHPRLFQAKCINYCGQVEVVGTFAHNIEMMNHNIPLYMKRYVPDDICQDITRYGMKFFRARAKDLFDLMLDLAKKNATIYNQQPFSRRKLP